MQKIRLWQQRESLKKMYHDSFAVRKSILPPQNYPERESRGSLCEYAYDSNGNLLSQTSSLKHSIYEYNPQNRMVRSRVVDDEARTIASTRYGYDVLGRRTLVQDNGARGCDVLPLVR